MTIQIKVLFFASAREAVGGVQEIQLEFPEDASATTIKTLPPPTTTTKMPPPPTTTTKTPPPTTMTTTMMTTTVKTTLPLPPPPPTTTATVRQRLAAEYPRLAPMVLDEDSITLALNEEYVDAGQVVEVKSGDTIALIPPISGG